MGRNTPVREFALQVGRLARLAYPELSSDTGTPDQTRLQHTLFNRIALEQFTAGLPPLLSRPIFENRVTDFQEAVNLAAHHEEINARFMRKTTIYAMQEESYPNQQGPSYPYIPAEYIAPIQHVGRPIDTGNSSSERNMLPGPRNGGNRPANRRQAPYLRRRGEGVTCYRCNQTGHIKRDCQSCPICGEWGHDMADCKSIVCAECKETGHPATRCPKNMSRRGQPRLNINC